MYEPGGFGSLPEIDNFNRIEYPLTGVWKKLPWLGCTGKIGLEPEPGKVAPYYGPRLGVGLDPGIQSGVYWASERLTDFKFAPCLANVVLGTGTTYGIWFRMEPVTKSGYFLLVTGDPIPEGEGGRWMNCQLELFKVTKGKPTFLAKKENCNLKNNSAVTVACCEDKIEVWVDAPGDERWPPAVAWVEATKYLKGELASEASLTYKAKADNEGQKPSTDGAVHWERVYAPAPDNHRVISVVDATFSGGYVGFEITPAMPIDFALAYVRLATTYTKEELEWYEKQRKEWETVTGKEETEEAERREKKEKEEAKKKKEREEHEEKETGEPPVWIGVGVSENTAGETIDEWLGGEGQIASWVITGLPPGLTMVNSEFGQIEGVPTTAGNYTVAVTLIGKHGAETHGTFEWRIKPEPEAEPTTFTNPGNQASTVGETVVLALATSPLDAAATATGLPEGLSIIGGSGAAVAIVGTPLKTQVAKMSVTIEGSNGTITHEFEWTVTEPTTKEKEEKEKEKEEAEKAKDKEEEEHIPIYESERKEREEKERAEGVNVVVMRT